jgi:1,4-dihydroxy-2-naphthoyl-CoA synthase
MSSSDGLWAEALATAVSQGTEDAIEGMQAFVDKRPPNFRGA